MVDLTSLGDQLILYVVELVLREVDVGLQEDVFILNSMLDGLDNKVGLKGSVFQDEPSGALRHVFPQYKKRQYTKESNGKEIPPVGDLSKEDVKNGSKRSSKMPGSINRDIDSSTVLWGEELINGCKNCSKLAAYTRMRKKVPDPGEEATAHKEEDVVGDD